MLSRRRAWLRLAALGCAAPLAGGALHLGLRQAGQQGVASAAPAAVPEDVCIFAPTLAWDGRGEARAPRAVPAEARCPVCGMFPARQPRWAVQLIYADGQAHFLDSPLSLFHYLQRVERYAPGRHRSELAAIYVSNHAHGTEGAEPGAGERWLPARSAVYVHGSDLLGPMRGGNLPALASVEAAQRLCARHGGQPLSFAALEQALPQALQALVPHRH